MRILVANAWLAQLLSATNEVEELRAIKGPVAVPSSSTGFGWMLLILTGVVIIVFLRHRYLTRKPQPTLAPASIPAHLRAKMSLRESLRLINQPKPFCTEVSFALRRYLEERFQLNAPDRTTEEFLSELTVTPALNPDQKVTLIDFLRRCDLVKFAKREPDRSELKDLVNVALRFVFETEPRPGSDPAPSTSTEPVSVAG